MDVRFRFIVTIWVILQVTWSASGLKVSLCNITSKSVPFKISPKSAIVQNATPLQIGPTCTKCISSSSEPNLQSQTKTSLKEMFLSPSFSSNNDVSLTAANDLLSSSKLLKKPLNTDVTLNPSLLELEQTQSLLRNSLNNLEILPLSSLANSPSLSTNKLVNTLTGVNNLSSLKSQSGIVHNSFSNTPNINTVLNSLPLNTLQSPLKQMEAIIGTNTASQNIAPNTSIKTGNILNLLPPSDQMPVLKNGISEFTGPQNVIINNPAVTPSNAVNFNRLLLSENNIASSKLTNELFNKEFINSRQNSPVSYMNNQVNSNVLDLTKEVPVPLSLHPSASSNKAINNNILSKFPGVHSDSTTKTPLINIPLDSRVFSPNISKLTTVKDNIQNNFSAKEYKPICETKLESLSLNHLVPPQYETQNQISQVPKVHAPVVSKASNDNNPIEQIINPNNNIERPIKNTNPSNVFAKEIPKQNTIIRNSATHIPLNIVESSFVNTLSNDIAKITNSNHNIQQEPLLTPKNPSSIQLNPNLQSPNTILSTNQANIANLNMINNFTPIHDFNNMDTELLATILSQLRNPVSIKNNENSVPKTTTTLNNNNHIFKPVEPLSVSNNIQTIDFSNLISPTITPFFSTNNMAPSERGNLQKTKTNHFSSNFHNINQCTPQKISLESKSVPFTELKESEIAQRHAIIKNENNAQFKLPMLPLNTSPNINKFDANLNEIPLLPLSINDIPEVTPASPITLLANSLDITQPIVNNLSVTSRSPALLSKTQSLNDIARNTLSSIIPQKPEKSLSTNLNNKLDNIKTLSPKLHINPSNGEVIKQPRLVSASPKPEIQLSPALSIPNSDSNNVMSVNNILPQNAVGLSDDLINPKAVQKPVNNIIQNPSMITTETASKTLIENNFAKYVQSPVTENMMLKSNILDQSQKIPYSITSVGNLPSVNAPTYTPPQATLIYANVSPSLLVPQIDKFISASDIIKPLNDMAAEVTTRYASLVRQKLDSKPTVSPTLMKPLPIGNAVLSNTESVSISQSEISNTPSVAPTSLFVSNNLSPNPYTTGNSLPSLASSATPTASTFVTDGVLLNPTISLPILSQTSTFSNEIETPAPNPYLSPLTINGLLEKSPPEIVIPTYLPTVDYKFLPSPTYPVAPSYPAYAIPPMFPPIIEAPILKTGCKESQDFKKILEILVLNELINNNNECKDRNTIETIIALLCAT